MSCAINVWLKHSKIVDKNKERFFSTEPLGKKIFKKKKIKKEGYARFT